VRVGHIRYLKPFRHVHNDEIYMELVCKNSLEELVLICHMLQPRRILKPTEKWRNI